MQISSSLFPDQPTRMPAMFIGHGSPMNAIEDNEFSLAWASVGAALTRPKAILCISAHWETLGTQLTAMQQPRTIYDFYGFPQPLYEKTYPASGSPDLACLVQQSILSSAIQLDETWGLDHGAWSVLCRMFPQADIPVVQLSLDRSQPPAYHYDLAHQLRPLRRRGILILGSGNMVHNLRIMRWGESAFDWALEADEKIRQHIQKHEHQALIDYKAWGHLAGLAIPTNEHYLPLLYILALQEEDEPISFFAEKVTLGSISMRSLQIS